MLAHFARLCTVFVRCLACLVGGFLLADLAFVVPRLAPVLCRMFSVKDLPAKTRAILTSKGHAKKPSCRIRRWLA